MPDHPAIARADIIIIGAGIMGASIAFQLSRQTDKPVSYTHLTLPTTPYV